MGDHVYPCVSKVYIMTNQSLSTDSPSPESSLFPLVTDSLGMLPPAISRLNSLSSKLLFHFNFPYFYVNHVHLLYYLARMIRFISSISSYKLLLSDINDSTNTQNQLSVYI